MRRAFAVLILALCGGLAHADEQAIRKMFKAKLPDAKVLSVRKLPYASLYEIVVQQSDTPRVMYTDADAHIVLVGANLIETATGRSVTEERMRQLTSIDWSTLPFRWAVTTRRGDGHREIAIFSDPNCPFCRKFERELATVEDITVHVFM